MEMVSEMPQSYFSAIQAAKSNSNCNQQIDNKKTSNYVTK
jgi:hypothetical protein